ncbi:MAG: hypothetical protein AABM41_04715 [Chloroflexota bacterium]
MTDAVPTPHLPAIEQRQQATWAAGGHHMVGTQIVNVSELLIKALDLHSTEKVLDVASWTKCMGLNRRLPPHDA